VRLIFLDKKTSNTINGKLNNKCLPKKQISTNQKLSNLPIKLLNVDDKLLGSYELSLIS
jgi:hypothetical protein